jgi:hypothetical protein
MPQPTGFSRFDRSILLRIVGSRRGADMEAIATFEKAHHRNPPTAQQIDESLARLKATGFIVQRGNHYFSVPEIQSAFFSEVRNCRDTVEELDVLDRVLARLSPPRENDP